VPRCAGRDVAVGGHESARDRPDAGEDVAGALATLAHGGAYPNRAVARAAVTALALALSAGAASAGAAGLRLPGTADRGVYPTLREVPELSARQADAGVGVYPALGNPSRLVFPSAAAVEEARRFAATRRGRISFAVADPRGGISGVRPDDVFPSASLVKAMLLVAYLGQAEREGRELSAAETSRLDAMIRSSDNDSATGLFRQMGAGPVRALARRAGMRRFAVGGSWGEARVTASDQARFFLALDRLLPAPRRREYARYLLANVMPAHRWGIPQAGRGRWRVFFKGGWRPNGQGELVHQAGLLEQGSRRVAIAVLSDGSPSEKYGQETVRGISERLLRPPRRRAASTPRPAPGRLAPLDDLDGYEAPQPRRLRPITPAATMRKVGSATVYFARGLR
jgi:Beta-lactamase enzyme family